MDFLKDIIPTAATLLGGPLAGMAVKFLAEKVGASAETTEAVTTAVSNMTGTPEGRARLAEIDADLRKFVVSSGVDLERLAMENARDINNTIQEEVKSEHWQTYSWRPAIGFAVAMNVFLTSMVVLIVFSGVILFNRPADALVHIPTMIGAMAALIGVVSPILGIAAWFRGRMQAGQVEKGPTA